MRTAVNRVDIVGERIDLFVVAVVVLNSDLDRQSVAFLLEVNRLVVKCRLILIKVLDEFRNAALVIKLMRTLRFLALVFDRYPNALIETRFFAQPLRELVKTKCAFSKDLRIGFECDLGSAFTGLSGLLERRYRNASGVFLFISFSIAPNLKMKRLRKKVNSGNTYAVQTARNFISV